MYGVLYGIHSIFVIKIYDHFIKLSFVETHNIIRIFFCRLFTTVRYHDVLLFYFSNSGSFSFFVSLVFFNSSSL